MSDEGTAAERPLVSIDDFGKLDLRVAEVVAAEPHPNADKLYVLKVKLGPNDTDIRQLVAGIRAHRQPEGLIGKHIVIVANLEPAKLRGIESQGMLLAAGGRDGTPLGLITVDTAVPLGTRIS